MKHTYYWYVQFLLYDLNATHTYLGNSNRLPMKNSQMHNIDTGVTTKHFGHKKTMSLKLKYHYTFLSLILIEYSNFKFQVCFVERKTNTFGEEGYALGCITQHVNINT